MKTNKTLATPIPHKTIKPRQFGRLKGRIKISDDFDAPLPDDILDDFENQRVTNINHPLPSHDAFSHNGDA